MISLHAFVISILDCTEEEGAEQNCEGCILHGLSLCPNSVGGRGVGSKEEFQKVYALADKLGAAGVDCDGL